MIEEKFYYYKLNTQSKFKNHWLRTKIKEIFIFKHMASKMESLIQKLNKWHLLKKEYNDTLEEFKRKQVRKKVLDAVESNDVEGILRLIEKYKHIPVDLDEFFIKEFKQSVKFNNKHRIVIIIKSVFLLEGDLNVLAEILFNFFEKLIEKMKNLSTSKKIQETTNLKEYDPEDLLGTVNFLNEKMNKDVEVFLENKNFEDIKILDNWLNEAVAVIKYDQSLVEEYKYGEIRYFSAALEIIKEEDKTSAIEDVIYLVNKIKRRSCRANVDINDILKNGVDNSGLLEDEEFSNFFKNLFPEIK